MSETVKQCCGTCKYWGPDGSRLLGNPPSAYCGFPVPQWMTVGIALGIRNQQPSVMMETEGTFCPCYTPKPEAPNES